MGDFLGSNTTEKNIFPTNFGQCSCAGEGEKRLDFLTCVFLSSAELSKHKRYEIRMSVYNAVGEGPSSPPQEVFVGEAGMRASCLCGEGATCGNLFLGVIRLHSFDTFCPHK